MNAEIRDIDLFENIFLTISEGIIVVDEEGLIIKANPAVEKMFGYNLGELWNQKIEVLLSDKYKYNHQLHRKKYFKNPKSRPLGKGMELRGCKKDKSEFPVEISLNPTKIKDKLVIIAGIIDITQRSLLSKNLLSNERKMLEVQALSGIGSWHWDLQTDEKNWSEQFYKIYGLRLGDERLNSQTIADCIHPEDRERVFTEVENARCNKIPYTLEKKIIGFDGKIRYTIEKGGIIYDIDGHPIQKFGTLQDISIIKKTSAALAESDRRISTLINNLPGFVYRIKNREKWEFEFVSDGCFAVSGYTVNNFMAGEIEFGQIILEEDRDNVSDEVQKALRKHTPYNIKYRIITSQGTCKYIWEQGEGVFNKFGKLEALEGFIQDVTVQKQLEIELKASEAKNKAILHAIPDTMFIQDCNGTFIDVYTPNYEKLFLPIDQIIGSNMKDILPHEIFLIIKNAQKRTIKSKQIQIVEYLFHGKNKKEYYEARIVPLNKHRLLSIVRDITETKEIIESLKLKNKALDAAGNGIFIIDAKSPDFPITYCNDSFVKMTGYGKEEVYGRNYRFLQNDDRNQQEMKIVQSSLADGKPCKVILRNYRKDATLFWNDLTITPMFNDFGDLTRFIGVQNDFTQHKNEELLKDQVRKVLEMITLHKPLNLLGDQIVKIVEENIDHSSASILLFDTKKETLHNLSGSKLPKLFKDSLEGVSIKSVSCTCTKAILEKKEIIEPDLTNDLECETLKGAVKNHYKACWSYPIISLKKAVLGTVNIYFTNSRIPQENERLIISDLIKLTSVAIEQYNSNIVLQNSREQLKNYTLKLENEVQFRTDELLATVKKLVKSNLKLNKQIQETKSAESRALSNQAMFLAISRNFPKGAIIVVNNDLKIDYIGGSELPNFETNGDDFIGLYVDDVQILNDKQKLFIKNNIYKTLKGGHLTFETEFRKNTYIVNTTPLVNNDGFIEQALFVYSNISEHKQVELELLNALKKEHELNELKSRFISTASHEFRTPLSSILSSANLIAKQPNEEVEKRKKYIKIIKSNVKNLVTILNDFLSLSMLEEGKILSQPQLVDLIDYTKSIIEEIEPNKKEGQSIIVKVSESKLKVFIDPKIIRLILTNLLSNAIKYSHQNGAILLTIKKKKESVFLEVADQGIGIPLEEQMNLFNRFFRAKNATNINGIGIGLYIVKQYIELIGGNIKFKSTLSEGTTFFVELPKNQMK